MFADGVLDFSAAVAYIVSASNKSLATKTQLLTTVSKLYSTGIKSRVSIP